MPKSRSSSNECTLISHRRSAPLDDLIPRPRSASAAPRAAIAAVDDDGGVLVPALEHAERERAERPDDAAVVVVVRWPLAVGVHDVFTRVAFFDGRDEGPRALVLGRHTEVDTPPLPGAALRHAVVLAWPPAPGEPPSVDVVDLNTDVGLGVHGGGAAAHLQSMGPMAFGVGAADVVVVPVAARAAIAPGGAQALLRSLSQQRAPVRRFRESAADGASLARVLQWHDELARGARAELPCVDVRSAPLLLPQRAPAPAPREALRATWQRDMVTRSAILSTPARLLAPDAAASDDDARPLVVATTWPALAAGVLLGRYPRCAAHEAIDDDGVSRVHALVLARRDRLFVVDTGSTNGTMLRRVDGTRVLLDGRRRTAMADTADELWLHRRRCIVRLDDDADAPAHP
jgi:hypothetical protein